MSKKKEKFAQVVWTADDIQNLKPDWSEEQCEKWLKDNQNRLRDRMVEFGWQVLEDLLNES